MKLLKRDNNHEVPRTGIVESLQPKVSTMLLLFFLLLSGLPTSSLLEKEKHLFPVLNF